MLRVLLVEDCAADAELIEHQMRAERMDVLTNRVQSRGEFAGALKSGEWDIILADFSLPQFGAMEVLSILRQKEIDLPVVLVTGTLSEEQAVEFIRQGGDDFILKSSLKRLGSAIAKVIEKKSLEREKGRAQLALRDSEERLRLIVDGVQDHAICMLGPDGCVMTWNSAAERIFGFTAGEIVGRHFSVFCRAALKGGCPRLSVSRALKHGRLDAEGWLMRRNGEVFYGNIVIAPLRDAGRRLRGFSHVVRDVTGRKHAEEALQKSHAQLRALAAKLQSSRETECIRIAREIHDELGQVLTAIKIDLSRVVDKLIAKGEPLAITLQATVNLTNSTIQSVQKIVTELRPRLLDELGLAEAIRWQVGEFQNRTGIRCRFSNRLAVCPPPGEISTAVYRIMQEALTNVARHAKASRAEVQLKTTSTCLRFSIRDNGRGVRPSELQNPQSLGILGMRERAELLGGCFDIRGAAKMGTQVTVDLPLNGLTATKR